MGIIKYNIAEQENIDHQSANIHQYRDNNGHNNDNKGRILKSSKRNRLSLNKETTTKIIISLLIIGLVILICIFCYENTRGIPSTNSNELNKQSQSSLGLNESNISEDDPSSPNRDSRYIIYIYIYIIGMYISNI